MRQFVFCFLIALFLSACNPPAGGNDCPTPLPAAIDDKPQSPMQIKINLIGETPHPLGVISVEVVIQSTTDAPNTILSAALPVEVISVDEPLSWSNDLLANQVWVKRVNLKIDALSTPTVIRFEAISSPSSNYRFGRSASLYIRPVNLNQLEISTTPFDQANPTNVPCQTQQPYPTREATKVPFSTPTK